MRRFSLYLCGNTWYVRFRNPVTKTYTTGVSTRERDRQAALAAIYHMEKYGLPDRGNRTVKDQITIDTILDRIRAADRLTSDDAEKIVEHLRQGGLVVSAIVSGGPASEPFINYLLRFWD